MSAVGNIGQFVIDNQYVIEIILLILLAIIVIGWLVGRLFMRPRRNAENKVLHAKIDKIESDINGIKDMTISEYVSGGETLVDKIERAVEAVGEEIEGIADDIVKDDKHLSESAWKIDETAESEIGKAVEEIGEDIEAVADEVVDADRELAGVVRIEEDDEAARIMESVLMEEKKGSKYISRDWNKDQHGNVYTEEMLKNLIG